MNMSDVIPRTVRDDLAWMALEQGLPVSEVARRMSVPTFVVSDAIEGFLRDARAEDEVYARTGEQGEIRGE